MGMRNILWAKEINVVKLDYGESCILKMGEFYSM